MDSGECGGVLCIELGGGEGGAVVCADGGGGEGRACDTGDIMGLGVFSGEMGRGQATCEKRGS